jgi:hypothetical protein
MSPTPVDLPKTATLRPTSGKILTVVIGAFAAVGLFSFVYRGIPRRSSTSAGCCSGSPA